MMSSKKMKWKAIYSDGSWLDQYERMTDNSIKENGYRSIDRTRLKEFWLLDEFDKPVVVLDSTKEKTQIVFRARNFIKILPDGTQTKQVIYILGTYNISKDILLLSSYNPNNNCHIIGNYEIELLDIEKK